MKHIPIALVTALLLMTSVAYAQNVVDGDACVAEATADWTPPTTLAEANALRDELDSVIEDCTLKEQPAPDESGVLFNAIPNSTINSRSCPGTDCEKVGQVDGGVSIPVYVVEQDNEEREWYSIDIEETIWIAGWLTRRGPDVVVELNTDYIDSRTGCFVHVRYDRGSSSQLRIAISGEQRQATIVDIYRPGETRPVPVLRQLHSEFVGSSEPYLQQVYRTGLWVPSGIYTIGVEYDGEEIAVGFDKDKVGAYILYVQCD